MLELKLKKYDDETLKKIHDLELMILKDFIKICDEHNLTYYMYAGSLLGTIRHNGFIPWDDDLDVIMFREDYERFKKIFLSSTNDKYELLTNETEKEYFYLFSKFMLKGTKFEEEWISQLNFRIGINIDIFVLDDLADNKYKRFYQLKKAFLYNRLLLVSKIKLNDLSFVSKLVSHSLYHILNFCKITPHKLNNRCLKFLRKYSNNNSQQVFDISATAEEYPQIFNRNDFKEVKKVQFEDIQVNVPKNYDGILKSLYGDYMELPPKEKRYNHPIDYIDFGKY